MRPVLRLFAAEAEVSTMRSLIVVMLRGVGTADIQLTAILVVMLSFAHAASYEAGWILRRVAVHSQDFGHVLRFPDLPLTRVLGSVQRARRHRNVQARKIPGQTMELPKTVTRTGLPRWRSGGVNAPHRLQRAVLMLDPDAPVQGAVLQGVDVSLPSLPSSDATISRYLRMAGTSRLEGSNSAKSALLLRPVLSLRPTALRELGAMTSGGAGRPAVGFRPSRHRSKSAADELAKRSEESTASKTTC